jgi:hypothetical protein
LYSGKYEVALKEKMLLKLEKDRLVAKVENMELSVTSQVYQGER